jgi:hypothetical protein
MVARKHQTYYWLFSVLSVLLLDHFSVLHSIVDYSHSTIKVPGLDCGSTCRSGILSVAVFSAAGACSNLLDRRSSTPSILKSVLYALVLTTLGIFLRPLAGTIHQTCSQLANRDPEKYAMLLNVLIARVAFGFIHAFRYDVGPHS